MPSELHDVEVETIGLVGKGANQEEFFLMKSDDSGIEPKTDMEAIESLESMEKSQGAWRRVWTSIANLFKSDLGEKAHGAVVQATEALASIPENEVTPEIEQARKALESLTSEQPEESEDTLEEDVSEDMPMSEMKKDETLIAEEKMSEEAVVEKTATPAPDVTEKLVTLEKANLDLLARLEKAEATAQAERNARRRDQLIAKSREFVAIPMEGDKYADFVMFLEKADGGDKWLPWVEGLLKATDHSLVESGLFNEVGTSAMNVETDPVSKVEKIAKDRNISAEAALLSLDTNDQNAILAARRAKGR